jgi:hypothetical protein
LANIFSCVQCFPLFSTFFLCQVFPTVSYIFPVSSVSHCFLHFSCVKCFPYFSCVKCFPLFPTFFLCPAAGLKQLIILSHVSGGNPVQFGESHGGGENQAGSQPDSRGEQFPLFLLFLLLPPSISSLPYSPLSSLFFTLFNLLSSLPPFILIFPLPPSIPFFLIPPTTAFFPSIPYSLLSFFFRFYPLSLLTIYFPSLSLLLLFFYSSTLFCPLSPLPLFVSCLL